MYVRVHVCLSQLFMKPSSPVLKECRTFENTNLYPNYMYFLQDMLPFSQRTTKWLLPLWKEWHMFIKIYGRHNGLFLECYSHLRVLLQSHATLSQGNVAVSVEECCMEVCHKFSRNVTCFQFSHDALWQACCYCCPKTQHFSREQYAYPCTRLHISVCCRELSGRCSNSWEQHEIIWQSKVKSAVSSCSHLL